MNLKKNQFPEGSFPHLWRGVALATTAAVMWALLSFVLKVGFDKASPQTLSWYRLASSATFLAAVNVDYSSRIWKEGIRHLNMIVLLASICLAFNYVGYAIGLKYTSPGNAQMLIQSGPFLTTLFAFLFGIEKGTRYTTLGFLTALVGFGIFYRDQLEVFWQQPTMFIKGSFWILAASLSWAIWALLQKQYISKTKISPWVLNFVTWAMCAVILTPWADPEELLNFNSILDWSILAFLSLNTVIAYGSYTLAYLYAPTPIVNLVVSTNPILVFFIKPDQVGWKGWLGSMIVIAALMISLWPRLQELWKKTKAT